MSTSEARVFADDGSLGTVRCAVGLAIVSGSILLLEVSATRLLSFISWHHFGFMVVSIAMLGLGAAGVLLATSRRLDRVPLGPLCVVSCWALGLLVVAGYLLVSWARFSPPSLASDLSGQAGRLVATSVGLLLPFLAGGVVVAACLSRRGERAATLYGGDLLGAGIGALAGVVLAGPLSIEQSVIASGIAAVVGAIVFSWPRRSATMVSVALVLALAVTCWLAPVHLGASPAPGKAMYELLRGSTRPAKVLATRNTALGRVDVVDASSPAGWSRNPRTPAKRPPPQLHVLIDGEADTPVALIGERPLEELDYLGTLPSSFVFALRRPERALILGAGGGQDVLSALRYGAREIDAVEVNPAIVSLMTGELLERSGRLYARPGVVLLQREGRSHVRTARERYDVVAMGLVDTWAAANVGGLSLTESFLYTTDAFEDYLRALRPGGMVGVTRWLLVPPRETLRLTVLAATALRRRGVSDPGRHIVVLGVGRVGALIVARDPLTEDQLRRVVELAAEFRLDIHWMPGVAPPEGEPSAFVALLTAEDQGAFVRSYPFDVSPVSDDRPFFFDFNTPRGPLFLAALFDVRVAPQSGTATLTLVLLQVTLLSLLLLVVPVASRRTRLGPVGRPLVPYFALTGLGFMFLEIPLLQRLTLVVGHPTQAVALVLGVLLGASGLASFLSQRLTGESRSRLAIVLVLLAVVAFGEALFGGAIGRASLVTAAWVRPLVAAAIVAPLGVLMGLPTPHGFRVVATTRRDLLPLLWATTSFASVVGSVLAVMLSMHHGFAATLAAGAVFYLLAAAFVPRSTTSRNVKEKRT